MTALKCLYIQALDAGNASDLRGLNAAILGGRNFENIAPGSGPIGRGHGVLSADAMLVTAAPTPDNTVQVAPGVAAVRGTQSNSQGSYVCSLDATATVTIAAKHASLTRTDLIVAQVKDAAFAAFTGDVWEVVVVQGTAGSGTPAAPEDGLVLAEVSVAPGSGATVITSTAITDLRPHARATGGITPVSVKSVFPNPQNYDFIWEISTSALLMYLNGIWLTIGRNLDANWTTYTPTFTNVSLGSGGTRYGRWQRFGRTVIGICGFTLGTGGNVTAGIIPSLPTPCYNPGTQFVYLGAGRGFDASSAVFWSCTGQISPSFDPNIMFNFATAGQVEWNALTPFDWAVGDQFRTFFNYEAA